MSTLIIPQPIPRPREDAKNLHDAFKGMGCDGSTIIDILSHRDASQLEYIQEAYESKFSVELRKRIASDLHGNFKKAVLLLLRVPVARDAKILRQALKGSLKGTVTDHKAASDVICSRTPSQLRQLKQVYHATFHTRLEDDIENETHGDHKKLLLAYVKTTRYDGPEINRVLVENDAKAIYNGERVFIEIFTDRSAAHLVALSSAYYSMYGKSLERAIKKGTSGYFEYALLNILRFVENPAKFFAKVLRKAMKGLGTDDSTLIWVIVTRAEIDMKYIKEEYKKKYKKTLNDAVYSETTGHYRIFLLSLLGPNC